MDRACDHCTHVTDDGDGVCRFCGTPFPAESKESYEASDAVQTSKRKPKV